MIEFSDNILAKWPVYGKDQFNPISEIMKLRPDCKNRLDFVLTIFLIADIQAHPNVATTLNHLYIDASLDKGLGKNGFLNRFDKIYQACQAYQQDQNKTKLLAQLQKPNFIQVEEPFVANRNHLFNHQERSKNDFENTEQPRLRCIII